MLDGLAEEIVGELEPGDLGLAVAEPDPKFEELVRELVPLEAADIATLQLHGPSRSVSGVETLRAFHHAIAIRLAAGERPVEISATLSVTQQTICRLEKEPQFQELVEGYRGHAIQGSKGRGARQSASSTRTTTGCRGNSACSSQPSPNTQHLWR